MVWRSLSDIAFVADSNLDKKIKSLTQKYCTPSKLQSETKKGYCSFKVYKNVSLWKSWQKCSIHLSFSEIFNLWPRKAGGFFIWELKKVVRLKQCPLYGSALEMREKEPFRKQTRPNVSVLLNKFSALEHDQFM